MTKKTLLLFLKALIVGIILNVGMQQASTDEITAANEQFDHVGIQQTVKHTPSLIKANYIK